MTTGGVVIVAVPPNTELLDSVVRLYRRNSRILGQFPAGAFDEAAGAGRILAATDSAGALLGYLLYREDQLKATIVHLCVDRSSRRYGVATTLFHHLAQSKPHLYSIIAKTRRDYVAANRLWERLGFAAVEDTPGRGRAARPLTTWWYRQPHRTLFDAAVDSLFSRPPVIATFDLNVLYDLHTERPTSEESRVLTADWLRDDLQLRVTPQVYNEINKSEDVASIRQQRAWASRYELISGTEADLHSSYATLVEIYGPPSSDRGEADMRHVAQAAAAGAALFVTRDQFLLNRSAEINERLGVRVLRPEAVAIQIDQLRGVPGYAPARLGGSHVSIARMRGSELDALANIFARTDLDHSARGFRRRLAQLVSGGSKVDAWVLRDRESPVSLIVMDCSVPGVTLVPVVRVRSVALATTLARFAINFVLTESVRVGHLLIQVDGRACPPAVIGALGDSSFVKAGDHWVKANVIQLGPVSSFEPAARRIIAAGRAQGMEVGPIEVLLETSLADTGTVTPFQLEQYFWPLKLTGAGIESFIVPIRPEWASNLFDSELAQQSLLPTDPSLVLRPENVYYRAVGATGGLSSESRLLWYVSKPGGYSGTQSIRACSQILELDVTGADEAFNRFRRLGVYSRDDVAKIAEGNPQRRVMVLRFSRTELFDHPIPREAAQRVIFNLEGKRPTFPGPYKVSEEVFAQLYRQGTGR